MTIGAKHIKVRIWRGFKPSMCRHSLRTRQYTKVMLTSLACVDMASKTRDRKVKHESHVDCD
jgi:hypothetical protein